MTRGAVAALACALWAAPAAGLVPDQLPTCPPKTRYCLAVEVWLPEGRQDDLRSWLTDQLEAANARLAKLDAAVQVTSIRALAAQDLDVDAVAKRDALGRLGQQTPLRWFVVDHLADNVDKDRARKGVTWRAGKHFWIIEDSHAWRWVLCHELGHVLGLPHSTQAASVMNKTPRAWPPPWRLGFTDRELPKMRATLGQLLKAQRLRLVGAGPSTP